MQIIFSSFSKSWAEHKLRYTKLKMWSNFSIEKKWLIVRQPIKLFLLGFSSVLNYIMEAVVHYLLFTWGTDFFGPLFRFFGGVTIFAFCFSSSLRSFSSSIFRRSSRIAPTVRCSAGDPDGNDVPDRAGPLAH